MKKNHKMDYIISKKIRKLKNYPKKNPKIKNSKNFKNSCKEASNEKKFIKQTIVIIYKYLEWFFQKIKKIVITPETSKNQKN